MKRSEMIEKLQDTLIAAGFKSEYECGCCHFEPALEQAEELLAILEAAGMTPPTYGTIEYHETTGKQLEIVNKKGWERE